MSSNEVGESNAQSNSQPESTAGNGNNIQSDSQPADNSGGESKPFISYSQLTDLNDDERN